MPLGFDLPLEQLRNYTGRNPRPEGFDDFWTRSLAELEQIPPELELVSTTPSALKGSDPDKQFVEYYDLWFTGIGGARIHAKLLKPLGDAALRRTDLKSPARSRSGINTPGKGPAILQFHGYTGDSGDWQSKLGLAAAGFTVAALDCRGQGGLSEDAGTVSGNTHRGHIVRGLTDAINGKPEKLLFRAIFLDTVRLARLVMAMDWVNPARVGTMGGSQGGALAIACAALEPRIARTAPRYPFLSDYKRVWEMDLATGAYVELAEWFRRFDPLHEREDEVFNALGYIDIQHLAPRIRGEVLLFTGLMDTICPPSTQFAAYNHMAAPKSLALYPDFAHEDLPGSLDRTLEFLLDL